MNNYWLRLAVERQEQEELARKYTPSRLIKEYPELAFEIAGDHPHGGLGCLTNEQRKIALGGRKLSLMDEMIFQEDCRVLVAIEKAAASVQKKEYASAAEKSAAYSRLAADNLLEADK